MLKYAGASNGLAEIQIRYGQEPDIEEKWKQIISIQDEEQRHKSIDKLLEQMEANCNENGFYPANEQIRIKGVSNIIAMDDKNLYYMFFDRLKQLSEIKIKDSVMITDGALINQAIQLTMQDYFGNLEICNKDKRMQLTAIEIVDGDLAPASISKQKGQCSSMCVERAVTTHNLWLLAGKASYCIHASENECDFGSNDTMSQDTHYYNIVEFDNTFRLYDLSLFNLCRLDGDPIKDIMDGKPLVVKGEPIKRVTMGKPLYTGVATPGVYANFPAYKEKQDERVFE